MSNVGPRTFLTSWVMRMNDQTTEERVLQLYRNGVPSSHIARRLNIARKEVNKTIRDYKRKEGKWMLTQSARCS